MAIDPAVRPSGATAPVLPRSEPEAVGLDRGRLERLYQVIDGHIAEGRYPGAQIAVARHGRLAVLRSFGRAKVTPASEPATDQTLWLLFSQTKMITAAALWQLVDDGALSFADRISDHMPDFGRKGKGGITIHQLLTHQGGFPTAAPSPEAWSDHARLREEVCNFELEWTPGSTIVYHGGSAHLVAAMLIETLTGRDYRDVIRERLLAPLGIADSVFVGVPVEAQALCADMYEVEAGGGLAVLARTDNADFKSRGVPGGGGYATAAGMQAFYQMLLAGGALDGTRVLSPRVIQYATRNHSGERPDGPNGVQMHRGMTPATRGTTATLRGLGTLAPPSAFGHGGAGSSYSWGDPESGLSFTYLSNARLEDPWHGRRLDQVSGLVHSSLVEP